MHMKFLVPMTLLATLALPMSAHAQGTIRGAEEGARQGYREGGPLGEILGTAFGAAIGTVNGILGVEDRPRFREYAVRERRPSYRYEQELRLGAVLPEEGVTYYDVPAEYRRPPGYYYTYVNDRPVLVERRTRRIVEILD
jgi:hypothetical protein